MIAFIFFCLVLPILAFSPVLGRDADQNEYPFLVALETCQKPVPCFPQCGGVVLSKSWILTLSSCIYRGNVRVNAGVVDLSSPDAQIREVEKAILHPEFNYSQPYSPNNIGLLKLKTPLDLGDSVQPGVLPKQGSDVPLEKVTQLGWFINKDGRGTPISVENLETVDTGIVDYDVCMAVVEPSLEYKLPDFGQTLLCTGDFTGREDICFINSGTPTLQNGVVVGLYDFTSLTCGVMGSALLSIKTEPYVSWIQENIDEEIKLA
ncbi:prostatic glandular kallikrein-6-like [Diabrotica virgifera virgifera]|uniref:Peptidase S1 domain-containing protein n=1 Tax=Diabrotica virgifera virgifera TaxID=50390 RepID=A0ABM5KHS2_DIAVI|nr:prostatic glandular kallikrein-6-like [Diabrotica virgifera virgifera]